MIHSVSGNILVTGGTGSVGQAFIDLVLEKGFPCQITVLSRDESKQYALQSGKYREATKNKKVKWHIGDVRDRQTMREAIQGKSIIVHTAAMKHVPVCEEFPQEAVQTNIISASNIVNVLRENNHGVRCVVACSTDKACEPTTAMGISKRMMEKIFTAASKKFHDVRFNCVRFGNLFESKGSVLRLFIEQAKANKPITLTSSAMTRFVGSLEDAADTLLTALSTIKNGMIAVRPCRSVWMSDVANVVWAQYQGGSGKATIEGIGARPAEKYNESLMSREEWRRSHFYDGHHCIYPPYINPETRSWEGFEKATNSGSQKALLDSEEAEEFIHTMIDKIES